METYPIAPGVFIDVDKARALVRGRKPNAVYSTARAAWLVHDDRAGVQEHKLKRRHRPELDEPVLLVKVAGIPVLVDGWHRTIRAHRRGMTRVAAHLLSEKEARRCAKHDDGSYQRKSR